MFLLDHPSSLSFSGFGIDHCHLFFDFLDLYNIIFPEDIFYYDYCSNFDSDTVSLSLAILVVNTFSHLTLLYVSNLVLTWLWKKRYSRELGQAKKFDCEDPELKIQIVTKESNKKLLYLFFVSYYLLMKVCPYPLRIFLYFPSFLLLPGLSTLLILSFGWKKTVKANFLPELIYIESKMV